MAKATAKQSITVAKYLGLTAMPSMPGIEAASQSWKKGAPLKNSSGKVAILTETDVAGILGIAAGAASGVTDRQCHIIPALPGVVFQAELSDLTDGAYTLAQTDIWGDFGLNVTTDGKWFVDADEAGGEQVVTVIGARDAIGTSNAIVYFVFKNSVTVFN